MVGCLSSTGTQTEPAPVEGSGTHPAAALELSVPRTATGHSPGGWQFGVPVI